MASSKTINAKDAANWRPMTPSQTDSERASLLGEGVVAASGMFAPKECTALPLGARYDPNAAAASPRIFWCLFISIPVFLGYGALLKLQSHLRTHLYISPLAKPPPGMLANNSPSAYLFGFCVSCYYIGLMVFRVGHNLILGARFAPRQRALLGYGFMAAALGAIAVLFYGILPAPTVGITDSAASVAAHHEALVGVLLCYLLGGVAVATFEPNMLSSLTPLGKANKSLAAVGIPIGTNSIAVVTLFLLGNLPEHAAAIEVGSYIVAALSCVLGAFVFAFKVPSVPFEASDDDARSFVAAVRQFRTWAPKMVLPVVVSVVDEFCLAMGVAIGQYIYGGAQLPVLSPFVARDSAHQVFVSHDHFLIAYFVLGFLGGVLSRHFTFFWRRRSPLFFLFFTLLGIGLVLSKIPLLAPLGMFFIMFGNGAIYATVVRYIDEEVEPRFVLVALSFWMVCGDLGGFAGANAVVPVHTRLGTV